MRQVEIVHAPGRRVVTGVAALALPEKDQFKTVAMPVIGAEVTGVIPPLGAELRMIEVIAGEVVVITGESLTVVRASGAERPAGEKGNDSPHLGLAVAALALEYQLGDAIQLLVELDYHGLVLRRHFPVLRQKEFILAQPLFVLSDAVLVAEDGGRGNQVGFFQPLNDLFEV